MEHMAHLTTVPQQHPLEEAQQPHVHTYFPPLPLDQPGIQPILIKEAQNLLSKGNNVGLRTWEAALHLGWYLLTQRPELVRGNNIVELGAGTGFLSLLCAGHLGASHVLATDGLGHVCESLQYNVDLNVKNNTLYANQPPEVAQLDWTEQAELDEILQTAQTKSIKYDLVIGADITYHPEILRPLAQVLKILSDAFPEVHILISSTIRNFTTFSRFIDICRKEFGFTVTEVHCPIPEGLRYSGFFHSVATEIKIISLST